MDRERSCPQTGGHGSRHVFGREDLSVRRRRSAPSTRRPEEQEEALGSLHQATRGAGGGARLPPPGDPRSRRRRSAPSTRRPEEQVEGATTPG
ncbi:hypothetical protein NHX12_005759 [Muraenolepis orangiensis]|uniref:Uncharacterized protein n=1 Tax=Muraenolepis orangiensis TaxID=630683 RepID=A0A9Q0ICA0_9TELE|nr:hypothetical protein NHX12_005759 [Muraenolepis orangiensis]